MDELVEKKEEFTLIVPTDWKKEFDLVKDIVAKNCSNEEMKLLFYIGNKYNLDPLKKEVWAVKYQDRPALIFVSRDGLLSIAHRTGQFGSMETTIELEQSAVKKIPELPKSATCIIHRKDYPIPFKSTVYFDEYTTNMALWKTKPKAMITKVAESTCLRRAFNIDGVLSPEETGDKEIEGKEVVVDG